MTKSQDQFKIPTDDQLINLAYNKLGSARGGIYQSCDHFHWYGNEAEIIDFSRSILSPVIQHHEEEMKKMEIALANVTDEYNKLYQKHQELVARTKTYIDSSIKTGV